MLRGVEHDCGGSASYRHIDQGSTASLRVVVPPSVEPTDTLDGVSNFDLGDPMKLRDLLSGAAADAQPGNPHRCHVPMPSSRCVPSPVASSQHQGSSTPTSTGGTTGAKLTCTYSDLPLGAVDDALGNCVHEIDMVTDC